MQAASWVDVGVLEVDQGQFGRRPAQSVALAIGLQQLELGHPVELVGEAENVGAERIQTVLPAAEDVLRLNSSRLGEISGNSFVMVAASVQVHLLEVQGGHAGPIEQVEGLPNSRDRG